MNTVFGLAAAAIGILIGMAIMWPALRKGASTKEAETKRWKLLWQGGLIGWILAVVFVQVIGGLREEFDEINRQRDERMRQADKLYQDQTDIIRKLETKP